MARGGKRIKTPPLFFAPAVSSVMRVEPAWIDYNGHLNVAWYNVLFDRAIDEIMLNAGLGPDYLAERRMSYFAAETHVIYKRELTVDTPVRATLQLVDVDEKRIHFFMELRHADEGWLAASMETLSLHMDMTRRRVAPFPPDIQANLDMMRAAHSRLPRPAALGRVMGIRRPAEGEPETDESRPRVLN